MATTAAGISLLDSVKRIAPVIKQNAAASEQDRRLSSQTVEAMRSAQLYRMCKPRACGGLELDPVTALHVYEEVSRLHPAAGWNLQISSAGYVLPAWLSEEGARELLSNPDHALAGAFAPPGRAIPVDGGYRVTGRWSFGSGGNQADWFVGGAFIYDDGSGDPRKDGQGQPIQIMVFVSSAESKIHDNWRTMGMRATGSNDFSIDQVFVPHHRAAEVAPLTRLPAACSTPFHRLSLWIMVAALATPALGAARAAIDALIELGKKTPNYTRSTVAERPVAQMQLARAEALVGAGRAYLHESVGEAWDTAQEGQFLDRAQKIKIQLAACHAIRSAADAIDLVQAAAGTSAIKEDQPFEGWFRDVHTMTQHAFGSAARFESTGKLLFGQPTDWPFFGL